MLRASVIVRLSSMFGARACSGSRLLDTTSWPYSATMYSPVHLQALLATAIGLLQDFWFLKHRKYWTRRRLVSDILLLPIDRVILWLGRASLRAGSTRTPGCCALPCPWCSCGQLGDPCCLSPSRASSSGDSMLRAGPWDNTSTIQ